MEKNNVWIILIILAIALIAGAYLNNTLFATQIRPANQQNVPEGSTAGSGYSSSADDSDNSDNCKSRWKCSAWSTCEDGWQYRDCEDLNDCWNENPNAEERTCGSSSSSSSTQDRACDSGTECVSVSKYKKCLTNGRWSGVLACPKGTTCGEVGCAYSGNEEDGGTDDCTPDWDCSSWGDCDSDTKQQVRYCTDLNGCLNDKTQSQACNGEEDGGTDGGDCNADWNCGVWSVCSNNQQYQTCTDLNGCKQNKVVTQNCEASSNQCIPILQTYNSNSQSCEYNMGTIYLIIGVIGLILLLSFLK